MAVYRLYEQVGAKALLAAMAQADDAGTYNADALALCLARPSTTVPPRLPVIGRPAQHAVDRALSLYEAWVQVDEEVAR